MSHIEHPAGLGATDRATRARCPLPTLAALVAATVAMSAGNGETLGAPDALADAQAARPFTPITDAMLARPDAADWLNWRRTPDGWGFSPLDQINGSQ